MQWVCEPFMELSGFRTPLFRGRGCWRHPARARAQRGGSRATAAGIRLAARGRERRLARPLSYRRYLARSLGEWSVAKNAYVESRSGWFCCRSACYLALGVPAVVQDTASGCGPDRRRRTLLLHARRGGGHDREPRLRPVSARPGGKRDRQGVLRLRPVLTRLLADTASQRTDALPARCTGASGGKSPCQSPRRNAAAGDETSLIQLPDAFGMKPSVD